MIWEEEGLILRWGEMMRQKPSIAVGRGRWAERLISRHWSRGIRFPPQGTANRERKKFLSTEIEKKHKKPKKKGKDIFFGRVVLKISRGRREEWVGKRRRTKKEKHFGQWQLQKKKKPDWGTCESYPASKGGKKENAAYNAKEEKAELKGLSRE